MSLLDINEGKASRQHVKKKKTPGVNLPPCGAGKKNVECMYRKRTSQTSNKKMCLPDTQTAWMEATRVHNSCLLV